MFDDLRERATAEYEYKEPESPSGLHRLVGGLTPMQIFILSVIFFVNVVVFGCMCLIASGRIQF